jgi:TatD DNase family protein
MAGFIDIACNFTHPSLRENLETILKDAGKVNVNKFVLLCASLNDLALIQEIQIQDLSKYFITAGIHPHNANEVLNMGDQKLLDILKPVKPHAIGETGLDYFRNISPPDIQRDSFGMHIEVAKELGLPLYLHQRDSHDDFIQIIKDHSNNLPRFVVHCFTGSQKELEDYLNLGAYIGLTGWVCDEKRNKDLRVSIKNIPLDRLMIETDCPYLIPKNLPQKPNRNINEPKYLPHIASEISQLMDISLEELQKETYHNSIRFFS